jgi:hypothetical protein
VVQERDVALLKTTFVAAAPPNVMLVGVARKLLPVIVTLVPPGVGPLFGEQLVTPGAGTVKNTVILINPTSGVPKPVELVLSALS